MVSFLIYYFALPILLFFFIKRFVLEKIRLKNLHQKFIFVTGCDTGFGHLLVLKLLKNNIPTFAGCLTESGENELKKKAKNLQGKLITLKLDVGKNESVKKAYESIQKELKGRTLWGLVCNAGVSISNGPDDWMTLDPYAVTIDINTFGVIRVCQQFKPLLKRSNGRIVIMSSIFGRIAFPYACPYVVSKFAVEGYADTIRLEARYFGFTVHILEPGFFNTNISNVEGVMRKCDSLWDNLSEEVKQEYGTSFLTRVKKTWKRSLTKHTSGNLDKVVDAYFHALTARFPRNRYIIGLDAKYFFIPLSFAPAWVQDKILWLMQDFYGAPAPESVRKSSKK